MKLQLLFLSLLFLSASMDAKWWCLHPQQAIAKGPYETQSEATQVCTFSGGYTKEGGEYPPQEMWKFRKSI